METKGAREGQTKASEDVAQSAGRGFLLITGAKIWFMLGGALITFGLPHLLGGGEAGKALYGQYFDLNNSLSVLSMVLITGGVQAVSRWAAHEDSAVAGGATRRLLYAIGGLATLVGGLFAFGAGSLAASRGNPELSPAYQICGLLLAAYGFYVVFIGALNGRRAFAQQALFDMGFTTLKVSLVLGAAALGFGVIGAFRGFALAAILICLIAALRVPLTESDALRPPPWRALLSYGAQVMIYTLLFNLSFKLDIFFLKPLALAHHTQGEADALVAVYGMALNFARLPWQATIAITFVAIPLLSAATFAEDPERSSGYIRQTLRYGAILIGAAVAGLAAAPRAPLFILPAGYEPVAELLPVLAVAYLSFSLFNLCNTLLLSAGKTKSALLVAVCTVAAAGGLYQLSLDGLTGEALIVRAAWLTLAAFTFGLGLALSSLRAHFGSALPLGSGLRIGGLIGLAALIGQLLPPLHPLAEPLIAAGTAVAFLLLLWLLREFNEEDQARLRRVLRGAKS